MVTQEAFCNPKLLGVRVVLVTGTLMHCVVSARAQTETFENRPDPTPRASRHYDITSVDSKTPLFLQDMAGNRAQPAFDPRPLHLGSMQLLATLELAGSTNSNVPNLRRISSLQDFATPLFGAVQTFAAGTALEGALKGMSPAQLADALNPKLARRADTSLSVKPDLRLSSDWGRHAVTLDASALWERYASLRRFDHTDFTVLAEGRLDIGARSNATAAFSYSRNSEEPGSNGLSLFTAVGFQRSTFSRISSRVTVNHEAGKMDFSLRLLMQQDRYDPLELHLKDFLRTPLPGGSEDIKLDQSFRSLRTLEVAPSLELKATPRLGLFLSGSLADLKGLNALGVRGRGGHRFGTLAGLRGFLTNLIVVQAGLGWQRRTYDDPALRSTNRFDYNATLDWYPTPRVSLRLKALQENLSSALPATGDLVSRSAQATVYYELRPNLVGAFDLGFAKQKYTGANLRTTKYASAFRINYRASPRLAIDTKIQIRGQNALESPFSGYARGWAASVSLTGTI